MIGTPNRNRQTERREATRREILAASWDSARDSTLVEFTLRDVASRVGMQAPSLYSHFPSKNAIYDAMFEQAWRGFLDHARSAVSRWPAEPRARLIAMGEYYFDYAVADLARHQLMDVRTIPGFEPSAQAYAPSVECYELMREELRIIGATSSADADVYTALLAGLVSQQLANDPRGDRWRRLIPRVMSMFGDDLDSRTSDNRQEAR